MSFYKKNLACVKLAITGQLEYRLNFFIDVLAQPVLIALIEMMVWSNLYRALGSHLPGNFSETAYVGYAMWAAFIARVTENWMYEFRMIDEIESGTVNSILVRPISFFEYYLFQFLGYKYLSLVTSFLIPFCLSMILGFPMHFERMGKVLLLISCYLVFTFLLSFCVASCAFFFNRIHALTAAKNILLWVLSGMIFPLDLAPEPWRSWLLWLPFSSGAYIPVGYLSGRVGDAAWLQGLLSVLGGICILGCFGSLIWSLGRKSYAGTGA